MPVPSARVQKRFFALGATALFHIAIIALILEGLPKRYETAAPTETETRITLLPVLPPLPTEKRKRIRQGSAGSNAITPYFNPYTYHAPSAATPGVQGLSMALAACAPEKYDMASDEIRTICGRIGALIRHDPGHFGVAQDVTDPKYWQRELVRREAPYLAPCMSSRGFEPLYTLYCIYDVLMHGYDPEKMQRYSK